MPTPPDAQLSFMVIAGEASGDALAAELVTALRAAIATRAKSTAPGPEAAGPCFYGFGGEKMAAAGVDIIFDLAENAVFGLEALTRLWEFRRRFHQLLEIAI